MDALALKLSIISLLINSVGTVFIGITVYLMWKQIKESSRLQRSEKTQETLDTLTTGEFRGLRDKIERDFNCRIRDPDENYERKISSLSEKEREDLDFALGGVLNILETLCIKIKNAFVEEDMCYDYLGFIMVEYKRWSEPFIAVKVRDNPLSLAVFVTYADRWCKRLDDDRKKAQAAHNLTPVGEPLESRVGAA